MTYCHVENMGESELLRITEECKNARFGVNVTDYGTLYAALAVLGPKLEYARVDFRGREYGDWSEIATAWNGCCNLTEVMFFGCEVADVRSLMAAPKPLLRILNLCIPGTPWNLDGSTFKVMMDMFSSGANGVEELIFKAVAAPIGTFDKFVEKSKSSLSSISIGVYNLKREVMRPFLTLPNLWEIQDGSMDRDMLKTLTHRGVQYLSHTRQPYYHEYP